MKCSGENNEFHFGHARFEVPVPYPHLTVGWVVGNVHLEQSRKGSRWYHWRTTGPEMKAWKDGSQWSILRKSSPKDAARWHVSARMSYIGKSLFLRTNVKTPLKTGQLTFHHSLYTSCLRVSQRRGTNSQGSCFSSDFLPAAAHQRWP